jgi:hypothetical protein
MLPFFVLVIATSVLMSSVLLDCIRWRTRGPAVTQTIFETDQSLTQSNLMCLMFQARARENNSERS